MKSSLKVIFLQNEPGRFIGGDIVSVVLAVSVGLILALLTFKLGYIALPIAAFMFLILPLAMKDPFKIFLGLIVTWPILTLYARFPLPAGIPDITYERIMVLLLVTIVLLQRLLSERKLHGVGLFGILAGIFIIAQIGARAHVLWFGGIGNPDMDGVLRFVLIPIAMYWLTKHLIVSRWHLKWLFYALILASVVICITGLIDLALGVEKSLFSAPKALGGTENMRFMDVPGGRAAGVMQNPGIYGAVLGMGVLVSLVCLVHSGRRLTKVALALTIVVLLFGIFASYTRAAWISVVVSIFIVQFFIKDLWKKLLPIYLVGILLAILAWGILVDNPLMVKRVLNPENVSVRVELGQFGLQEFSEKPLMGWGFGAFDKLALKRMGFFSHNTYLSLLTDGGIFLFLSFLALPVYLLYVAYRANKNIKNFTLARDVLAAMIGCLLIFLLSGFVRELNHFGYFYTLVMICAAVIENIGAAEVDSDGMSEISMLARSIPKVT